MARRTKYGLYRRSRYDSWRYREAKLDKLIMPRTGHTMLVAWHKFDRFERYNLSLLTGISLDRLPFTKATIVYSYLKDYEPTYISDKDDHSNIPVINYGKRILRAVYKAIEEGKVE